MSLWLLRRAGSVLELEEKLEGSKGTVLCEGWAGFSNKGRKAVCTQLVGIWKEEREKRTKQVLDLARGSYKQKQWRGKFRWIRIDQNGSSISMWNPYQQDKLVCLRSLYFAERSNTRPKYYTATFLIQWHLKLWN